MGDQSKTDSLVGKFGAWLGVYGIYLFLAGWTYLDYYFAVFGINAKWLEFGLNDVIARGFTVLFDAGAWLSIVYLVVFGLSLIVEAFKKDSGVSYVVATILLAAGLIPTYSIAKSAGISRATTDRGDKTTLATVIFTEKHCAYRGKLLYVKGETLFVYDLVAIADETARAKESDRACPIQIEKPDKSNQPSVPQLWMIRASDLEDVRIDHYDKEPKP
jgi:hypothetical protein